MEILTLDLYPPGCHCNEPPPNDSTGLGSGNTHRNRQRTAAAQHNLDLPATHNVKQQNLKEGVNCYHMS